MEGRVIAPAWQKGLDWDRGHAVPRGLGGTRKTLYERTGPTLSHKERTTTSARRRAPSTSPSSHQTPTLARQLSTILTTYKSYLTLDLITSYAANFTLSEPSVPTRISTETLEHIWGIYIVHVHVFSDWFSNKINRIMNQLGKIIDKIV